MTSSYTPLQQIPFAPEAEEAVLGSVLVNPSAMDVLAEFLKPADFFLLRNNYVWEALSRLHERGESIDYLTTVSELKAMGRVENVGGEVYLIGLFRNTPTSIHAEAYGRIVERAAIRRHLMTAADEIRGLAMNENMALEEVIAEADNCLYLATARHIAVRTWEFKSRSQIMEMPDIEWLIPKLLPVRSLGMIFGASGSFKSFYALDKSIEVAQHKNVLYIVAEGESGTKSRLQAHERHFRRNTDNLTFCLGAVSLFSDVELMAFKRLAARYKPELVVVDTFAMCTGDADENNTRDMKTIVEGCKRMIVELGCAVLVVHHTNKEGKVERGNASFRNACDTVIRLSLLDDVIKVEHQKSKDKALPAPEYYRRVVVDLGYKDALGEPVTSVVLEPSDKVIADTGLTIKQRAVLEAIAVEPGASVSDLAEIVETSRGAVTNILRTLTHSGYLSAWDGKQRAVTKEGRAAMGDSTDSTDSTDSNDESAVNQMNHLNQRIRQNVLFPPANQYDRGN